MRRLLLVGAFGLAAALVFAALGPFGGDESEAAGPPQIASALGRANIAGQEVYVRVTVAAAQGSDADAAARAELARRGAVPVSAAAFTTNGRGLRRFSDSDPNNDQIDVTFYADSAPSLSFDVRAEFVAGVQQWNGVTGSNFHAGDPVDTDACPSLVAACPGPQTLDGEFGTGVLDLGGWNNGSLTLGVTYFCFRGNRCEEADMVLNSNSDSPWMRDANDSSADLDFDMRTVAAHEFGHMWAIGHSSDTAALMYPYYHGGMWTLGADDMAALVHLYPASDGGGDSGGSWCDNHDSSHPAWDKKGCGA